MIVKMKPHEERVVTEKTELDVKRVALSGFLTTTVFQNLPVEDQYLLTAQLTHMDEYSEILGKRILRFGGTAP